MRYRILPLPTQVSAQSGKKHIIYIIKNVFRSFAKILGSPSSCEPGN